MSDILAAIDAATDNLCACGCQQPLPHNGPSAYFASPDCQRRWNEAQAEQPHDVYRRVDAAPYPPGPMRWRPDLVTAEPDPNLQAVDRPELAYHGRYNAAVYEYTDRDGLHLRLDDGHRFVGADLTAENTADPQHVADTWLRLERELGNPHHLAPADDPWEGLWPQDALSALRVTPEQTEQIAATLHQVGQQAREVAVALQAAFMPLGEALAAMGAEWRQSISLPSHTE